MLEEIEIDDETYLRLCEVQIEKRLSSIDEALKFLVEAAKEHRNV